MLVKFCEENIQYTQQPADQQSREQKKRERTQKRGPLIKKESRCCRSLVKRSMLFLSQAGELGELRRRRQGLLQGQALSTWHFPRQKLYRKPRCLNIGVDSSRPQS